MQCVAVLLNLGDTAGTVSVWAMLSGGWRQFREEHGSGAACDRMRPDLTIGSQIGMVTVI